MKKNILGAALAFAILISPTPLYAAGLNTSQIQAILAILSAFGADTATIANVSNALNGTSQTIITTTTGTTTTAVSPTTPPSAYLRFSPASSSAINEPFTISLFGSNSPTKYWLRIDGQEKDFGMTTSWTGTPATLGFTARTSHEFYTKACNSAGCSNWDGAYFLNVTAPVATSTTTPMISITSNGSRVSDGDTVSANGSTASVAWNVPNATSCALNNVAIPTSGSKTVSELTTSMWYTMNCTNAYGSKSLKFYLSIATYNPAPTVSMTANGSPITSGSTVTAAGGTLPITWSSTSATALTCTLNGVSVPTSGSKTLTGVTSSSHTYTCTNAFGSKSLQFNVSASTTTSTTFGTYNVFINNVLYPARAAVTRSFALADCMGQKDNNPTASLRCTWNGEEILNYVPTTTAQVPAVPSAYLQLSNAAPALDTPFTISLFGSNSPTKYWLRIDGQEKDFGMTTSWTGTPATLGFSSGTPHELYVKACNASGCSAWDGAYYFSVAPAMVLGASTVCVDLPYNMYRGFESASVGTLQTFFMSVGLMQESTGFYGDKTVAAVEAYQGSKGLPQTGMAYDFTRRAIQEETCK